GILPTPFNADIPRRKLEKEAASGLTILPLQYSHKAELYRYVRAELRMTERYVHKKLPHEPEEFNPIDSLLVHAALPVRMKGVLSGKREDGGIHLHYAHPSSAPVGMTEVRIEPHLVVGRSGPLLLA